MRTLALAGTSFKAEENASRCSFMTGTAGWHLIMDEHGRGKVPVREHGGNMCQVRSDRFYVLGIVGVVRGHFDGSAV
jgi:hypothetical protein